jgi:hypothetical protein
MLTASIPINTMWTAQISEYVLFILCLHEKDSSAGC